jgi:MFS family permease
MCTDAKHEGQPSFIQYFDLATRSDASALIGSLNGVFQAGGVVGTLLLPTVADRYGRKVACIVVCRVLPLMREAPLNTSLSGISNHHHLASTPRRLRQHRNVHHLPLVCRHWLLCNRRHRATRKSSALLLWSSIAKSWPLAPTMKRLFDNVVMQYFLGLMLTC